MCLAYPMRVTEIDGLAARCEAKGIERVVSLVLLQEQGVQVGDFVIVHLGTAVGTVPPEEARSAWALLDELLALESAAQPEPAPVGQR